MNAWGRENTSYQGRFEKEVPRKVSALGVLSCISFRDKSDRTTVLLTVPITGIEQQRGAKEPKKNNCALCFLSKCPS